MLDRTGQIWEYSVTGVFLVIGASRVASVEADDMIIWMDHPIVWLDDKFTGIRVGRRDGFIEYPQGLWETRSFTFKRVA